MRRSRAAPLSLDAGYTFRGGFYNDTGSDFLASIENATYAYWVWGNGSGNERSFNGQGYYPLLSFDSVLSVTLSTVAEAADFGAGTINGQVTQFVVVPEPGTLDRARVQPIPEINLMGGYQRQVLPAQNQGLYQVMLEVPLFDRNQGNIRAATADIAAARAATTPQAPAPVPRHRAIRGQLDLVQLIVYCGVMRTTQLNIHEAKTHLSRLIARLKRGDRLIICNRHRPVAEVRPIPRPGSRRRRLGVARGEFVVPQVFFEPLPESLVEAFEGRA